MVTEAELQLLPAPAARARRRGFLRSDDDWRWMRSTLARRPRRACSNTSTRLARAAAPALSRDPAEAAAALLIEQELECEDDPELDAWLERMEASGALAEASWFATTAADRERFRRFRHSLPELVNDTVRRARLP